MSKFKIPFFVVSFELSLPLDLVFGTSSFTSSWECFCDFIGVDILSKSNIEVYIKDKIRYTYTFTKECLNNKV